MGCMATLQLVVGIHFWKCWCRWQQTLGNIYIGIPNGHSGSITLTLGVVPFDILHMGIINLLWVGPGGEWVGGYNGHSLLEMGVLKMSSLKGADDTDMKSFLPNEVISNTWIILKISLINLKKKISVILKCFIYSWFSIWFRGNQAVFPNEKADTIDGVVLYKVV